jgi:RNA polymerase sigma factor (sigma-70 family)
MEEEAVHRLISRIAAGDRLAVHLFYRRIEGFLRGLARRSLDPALRRRLDSTDVAQSAFRRILASSARARLEDEAHAMRWVATIVRNRIRAEARSARVRRAQGEEAIAQVAGPPSDPAAAAEDADAVRALEAAMGSLSPDESRAVVLHDFQQQDFETVAKELGRPSADAARKLHARAIARLRKALSR